MNHSHAENCSCTLYDLPDEYCSCRLTSDNAGFDVHLTDPSRLKGEIKSDIGLSVPRWNRLTDKQKSNVVAWAERNKNNTIAIRVLKYLKSTGFVPDGLYNLLPEEAFR